MQFIRGLFGVITSDKPIKFGWISKSLFLLVSGGILYWIFQWLEIKVDGVEPPNAENIAGAFFLGVALYSIKIMVSGVIYLRNRRHMLKALSTYISGAEEDLKENQEKTWESEQLELVQHPKVSLFRWVETLDVSENIADIEAIMDRKSAYVPYPMFDPTKALTFETIKNDYSFLHSNAINAVVEYVNAEAYALSAMQAMSDELVINMKKKRRLTVIKAMFEAKKEWHRASRVAREELDLVKDLRVMDWVMNFLVLPRLLVTVPKYLILLAIPKYLTSVLAVSTNWGFLKDRAAIWANQLK